MDGLSPRDRWLSNLVVAELVLKRGAHAFGETGGTINVAAAGENQRVSIVAADNGRGAVGSVPGTGSHLVDARVAALDGGLTFVTGPTGTLVRWDSGY